MRTPVTSALLVVAVAACGSPDVDSVEERQLELRNQLEDLQTQMETLHGELQGAGLVAQGEAPGGAAKAGVAAGGAGGGATPGGRPGGHGLPLGNPTPENPLNELLPFTITRTGEPPELPRMIDPERLENVCGWRFVIRSLQPISDFPLNRDGYGKSSPVIMRENGKPMNGHATPTDFEDACTGSYRHAGNHFLFSPSGSADAAETHSYEIVLDPRFPMPRGDDERPMYWVYPGTAVTVHFKRGWDEEAWGKLQLTLAGRVAGRDVKWPAAITVGEIYEDTSKGKPPTFIIEQKVEPVPQSDFKLELASPEEGPYLLIDTLTLGNRTHAVVITSDKAWRATQAGEG